jgi:hypothetical protein
LSQPSPRFAISQENSGDAGGSLKGKRLKSKLLKWGQDDPINAIGLKSPPDIISKFQAIQYLLFGIDILFSCCLWERTPTVRKQRNAGEGFGFNDPGQGTKTTSACPNAQGNLLGLCRI